MEHGEPGQQDDRGDPEMNIAEDHTPEAWGLLGRVVSFHEYASLNAGVDSVAKSAGVSSGRV
jgi:hypothetical protein